MGSVRGRALATRSSASPWQRAGQASILFGGHGLALFGSAVCLLIRWGRAMSMVPTHLPVKNTYVRVNRNTMWRSIAF